MSQTRVPLLEVLCAGARPIALVDALCVEWDPTGQPMIDEIRWNTRWRR